MAGVAGKISWFGGPGDPTAGPTTASGASVTEPGIAVYNHATLGGYWLMTLPNGRRGVYKQTDIGPAPWTGRKYDFTYSALAHAGYTTANFPTDATATGEYLGKSVPRNLRNLLVGSDTGPVPSVANSADPTTQALLGSQGQAGSAGGLLGQQHTDQLKYSAVWIGAIALALYLFYHGLDNTSGGAISRTTHKAGHTALEAIPK